MAQLVVDESNGFPPQVHTAPTATDTRVKLANPKDAKFAWFYRKYATKL